MVAAEKRPVGRPRLAIKREEPLQVYVEPAVARAYRQLGIDDRKALLSKVRNTLVNTLTKKGLLDDAELAA